jgi:hypothetical protein
MLHVYFKVEMYSRTSCFLLQKIASLVKQDLHSIVDVNCFCYVFSNVKGSDRLILSYNLLQGTRRGLTSLSRAFYKSLIGNVMGTHSFIRYIVTVTVTLLVTTVTTEHLQ